MRVYPKVVHPKSQQFVVISLFLLWSCSGGFEGSTKCGPPYDAICSLLPPTCVEEMELGARRLIRSLMAAGLKDLPALKARSLVCMQQLAEAGCTIRIHTLPICELALRPSGIVR